MRIDRFSSTQFRNLNHDPVDFSPGVNLFVGQNGHGKTNILEAIHFFKFGRSFRTSRDSELVRYGEAFCRIEVGAQTGQGDRDKLESSIERRGVKQIKLNGKQVGKYSELVGRYPCVMFGPHDLALISGFPAERRKFIDMVGSMTDRGYLEELKKYRRVLTQRNAALKKRKYTEAQGVWTEELIERGCAVTERRLALVSAIRDELKSHVDAMQVVYAINIEYESELTRDRPQQVACEEQFAARLAAVESEENRRGVTLVGPHRDDVRLLADGHDLRRYGSQGQRRLVAILLRLAEMSYIEGRLHEPCVLLLDDLFSELDDSVTERLKKLLTDHHQIFITSPAPFDWARGSEARVFRIEDGRIDPE